MVKAVQRFVSIKVDGKVVANCLGTVYFNGKANCMMVDSVYVEEKFRRKGYGTMLMQEIIDLAREMGVDSVELVANKDNVIADKLYLKVGFKPTEKVHYRLLL